MEAGNYYLNDGRIALPVAGDDPPAKTVVMRLVDEWPVAFGQNAGRLDESWRQLPGRP